MTRTVDEFWIEETISERNSIHFPSLKLYFFNQTMNSIFQYYSKGFPRQYLNSKIYSYSFIFNSLWLIQRESVFSIEIWIIIWKDLWIIFGVMEYELKTEMRSYSRVPCIRVWPNLKAAVANELRMAGLMDDEYLLLKPVLRGRMSSWSM